MHLHLDIVGGIAGDMFCAAVLDAFPAWHADLQAILASLALPSYVRIELKPASGHLRGSRFIVHGATAPPHPILTQQHAHRHYADIRDLLDNAALPALTRTNAHGIFRCLAEAEAHIHQVDLEQVAFHEVGNWDSIVDIVSAAYLLERLAVSSVSISSLPLGRGRVMTAHGLLPVPAPATAYLLEGFPLHDDGVEGERITPTGAAIVKYLQPRFQAPGQLRLQRSGTGFGSKHLGQVPNCVRVLILETEAVALSPAIADAPIAEIRCEIDDQNPEDLAIALDHLRALTGVLSVHSLAAIGKQGRMTQKIEILAHAEALDAVCAACLRDTATLGVRWQLVQRRVLARREHEVTIAGRAYQVKTAVRPDAATAKLESRELLALDSYAQRQTLRYAAEQQALKEAEEPPD